MEKGIKETQSDDVIGIDKVIEDGIKVLARIVVKEILREFTIQRKTYYKIPEYYNLLFPNSSTNWQEKPLTLSVAETARLLGVSRGKMYEAVYTKQIHTIRIGRRILIPRIALSRFLEGVGTTYQDSLHLKT